MKLAAVKSGDEAKSLCGNSLTRGDEVLQTRWRQVR